MKRFLIGTVAAIALTIGYGAMAQHRGEHGGGHFEHGGGHFEHRGGDGHFEHHGGWHGGHRYHRFFRPGYGWYECHWPFHWGRWCE